MMKIKMILLRQNEYASRDYEGLDAQGQKDLRSVRDQLAKKLWDERKKATSQMEAKRDSYVSDMNKYNRALYRGKFDKAKDMKANNPNLNIAPKDFNSKILGERNQQLSAAQNQVQNGAANARNIALNESNYRAEINNIPKSTPVSTTVTPPTTINSTKPGMSTGGKVALGVAGAGTLAAAGYGIYRHFQNKKKKKQQEEL